MSDYRDYHGKRIVVKDQTFEGVDFYVAEDRVTERKLEQPRDKQRLSDAIDGVSEPIKRLSLDRDS